MKKATEKAEFLANHFYILLLPRRNQIIRVKTSGITGITTLDVVGTLDAQLAGCAC